MSPQLLLSAILLPLLAACSASPSAKKVAAASGTEHAWTPPSPGGLAVADSMKVKEDALNNAYFSVRLNVSEGNSGKRQDGFSYDVHASYGQAVADGKIVMPFGGENLRPLLRKGPGYTYIVGFIPGPEYGGDMNFHEYYRIEGDRQYIRIRPMNGFKID